MKPRLFYAEDIAQAHTPHREHQRLSLAPWLLLCVRRPQVTDVSNTSMREGTVSVER